MSDKNLLDSSISKMLICNGLFLLPCGLRHVSPELAGETIGPERAKSAATDLVAHGAKSARTLGNPRKHAGVGEKKPTGDPVGFSIWWGGVYRTTH